MAQVDDLSRSLVSFEQNGTLVVVLEMSQSSWLAAGVVPAVERRPLKKIAPDPTALLHLWSPFFDALLAEVCEFAGKYEEAAQLFHDAERTVERRGARWFAAEPNRRQGRLLQRQGCIEAAEQLHRKAISITVEQEARLWELRAATRPCSAAGRNRPGAEARQLLAPIYSRFNESFETADLRETKTLLDAMAQARRS